MLVLYTDGVTEAFDENFEAFGMERLQAAITQRQDRSAQEVLDGILEAVEQHTAGTTQSDDMTILILKGKPALS
jgi:sigma-B regulation protein RsbU (phosphoserine phosphatase)